MCLSKTIFFVFIFAVTWVFGNTIPITAETIDQQWISSVNQKSVQVQSSPTPPKAKIQEYYYYYPYPSPSPGQVGTTKNAKNEATPSLVNQYNNLYQYRPTPQHAFSKFPLPGRFINSTVPQNKSQEDDYVLQPKLGTSLLTSLLPPPSLGFKQVNTEDTGNLMESDQTSTQQGNSVGIVTPPFRATNEQFVSSQDDSSQEVDPGSDDNIFTRVRNILPFGRGLLSGLLNNENNEMQEDAQEVYEKTNRVGGGIFFQPSVDSKYDSSEPSFTNLFALSPSQMTSTYPNKEHTMETTETGSNFFSVLLSPIQRVIKLFHSFTIPPDENSQGPESGVGYYEGDSAITPLKSVGAGGGLIGTLKIFVPYLAYFVSVFKLIKAKLPLVKILGAIFGPILAAAIAGMVVGLVYVSIYVAAGVAQNVGAQGGLFIVPLKQLMDMLGVGNPLENLLANIIIGRSFQDQEAYSRLLGNSSSLNETFMIMESSESNACMQKIACQAIGRKFLGNPSRKEGWLGKGIRWISNHLSLESIKNSGRREKDLLFRFMHNGKSLIDAIAIGMEQQSPFDSGSGKNSTSSSCAKYSCDPIASIQEYFVKRKNSNQLPLTNVTASPQAA